MTYPSIYSPDNNPYHHTDYSAHPHSLSIDKTPAQVVSPSTLSSCNLYKVVFNIYHYVVVIVMIINVHVSFFHPCCIIYDNNNRIRDNPFISEDRHNI